MVLPSHDTVPTHHLGLMSGFMGAHTTQSPPGAGILGTPRLCVASARACTLYRGAAVAQGPERGTFYLRAGLKYGLWWIPIGGLFCIRIQRIQSSQTAKRASAFGTHVYDVRQSPRSYPAQKRQRFRQVQDPTAKETPSINRTVAPFAVGSRTRYVKSSLTRQYISSICQMYGVWLRIFDSKIMYFPQFDCSLLISLH